MAMAGAILVVTAPQSLGPGNRRASTIVAAVLFALLGMVGFTTWTQTSERDSAVTADAVSAFQLETSSPTRTPIVLGGQDLAAAERVIQRYPNVPRATADDCGHASESRVLPAATQSNVNRLNSQLQAQGRNMNGTNIRAANCLVALAALRWEPALARAAVFLTPRPERSGALTYLFASSGLQAAPPAELQRLLGALQDTSRFQHGSEAAQRFTTLARVAGDTATEVAWRGRIISGGATMNFVSRPAYTDGTITGRLQTAQSGWRVGLLAVSDPSGGESPLNAAPRNEASVLGAMVAATDAGADGRFSFTGLRDGWYMLAVLTPDGAPAVSSATLAVRGDPGPFQLEPTRRTRDVGTVTVTY